jgi:hypothetical protein
MRIFPKCSASSTLRASKEDISARRPMERRVRQRFVRQRGLSRPLLDVKNGGEAALISIARGAADRPF